MKGYRHFEVNQYCGRNEERCVKLFPVNNKDIRVRISWTGLRTLSVWTSGWLQLPNDESCTIEI